MVNPIMIHYKKVQDYGRNFSIYFELSRIRLYLQLKQEKNDQHFRKIYHDTKGKWDISRRNNTANIPSYPSDPSYISYINEFYRSIHTTKMCQNLHEHFSIHIHFFLCTNFRCYS